KDSKNSMASTAATNSRARHSSLPKLIKTYYSDLTDLAHQYVMTELGTRTAFQVLLQAVGKRYGWTFIAEQEMKVAGGRTLRPDGTFKDRMNIVRGYWEAKDSSDKLDAEIAKKLKAAYPTSNIIFEDTVTAVLLQHGAEVMRVEMADAASLQNLIIQFF